MKYHLSEIQLHRRSSLSVPTHPPGDAGDPGRLVDAGGPSRKICTVSVVDETQSKVELRLNDMLYIVEG